MNIKGLNFKGVGLFPTLEKELFPCYHKHGAVATWSQNTDAIKKDYPGKEINAIKYNFDLTAFISPFAPPESLYDIDEVIKTGVIRFGIYYYTFFWFNPVKQVIEQIPDFLDLVWSQESVDANIIDQSMVGTAKPSRYPYHGKQIFDLTNGLYGYNPETDQYGEIEILTPVFKHVTSWFKKRYGRYPSAASYRFGVYGPSYALSNHFMGGRNSVYDLNSHSYDFTKQFANNKLETTRYNDMTHMEGISREEVRIKCAQALENAIINNGWYSDFAHWHNSFDTETGDYLASQRAQIAGRDVITLDYGTALEYMFLRNMVRRAGLYTDGNDVVVAVDFKDYEDLLLDRIETDVSIDVDLTGTILEGKEITGVNTQGIRKLGVNRYAIEVSYAKNDSYQTVRLSETSSPNYLDFTLPVINEIKKSGDTISVTTDKETKVVVYSVPRGFELYHATILYRGNSFNTLHKINVAGIDLSTTDVYVGVVTKERQSILSSAQRF